MAGPHGPQSFAKPKQTKRTIVRIFQYMLLKKSLLALVMVFVLLSALAGVAGNYLLKPIINDCIAPLIGTNPTAADFLPLVEMIVLLAVIYLVGAGASYYYNQLMINVTNETLHRLRNDLFQRLEDLPIRYFDTHTHGELMSRFTNDVDTLRIALSQSVTSLFSSAITIIGTFIMMLLLSPLLTLFIVLMLVLMLLIVKTIGKRSAKCFRENQRVLGNTNGYIEEMIDGIKVVKAFCHEEEAIDRFLALNEEQRHAATDANTLANIMMPIMNNLGYFNYAITASVGALMVITGRMDLGSIASFLQYTRSFSQPITQISQQFNSILSALAGAERIFEVIDETPEVDDGYVTLVYATLAPDGAITESATRTGHWAWKHPHGDGTVTYTLVQGDVRLEDVTFGYVPEKDVLRDVTLYAEPDSKIAFVGSTGAGKTTITNLINRFYDVPDGKIRYDGINITKIKKADLRRSMAMVLQDTHLFTGTVGENIAYGKLDATKEEIIAAAKIANADTFIKHLPDGYDTLLVADGANLSQGQRQLLSIARAAVADPPVLVLDEATSSIDTRTEALIESGMDTLMKGRTVFVIAHRLSTVRNSDHIVVLEQGQIIERGSHQQLLDMKGKYYQLCTGQFELS